jgi:hypothetical protein
MIKKLEVIKYKILNFMAGVPFTFAEIVVLAAFVVYFMWAIWIE